MKASGKNRTKQGASRSGWRTSRYSTGNVGSTGYTAITCNTCNTVTLRPDALNTTQKTPALCNVLFLNKARKTFKKNGIFEKIGILGIFS